ncbi:Nitrate reductase [Paraglaciecola mesophila]|uniref:Nitrate reductase n=1 Tax=Paraglaciecola mesophila TaxID=197222 RepID=A0A857JDB5_9ALTE|nr:nitrate reductase [Paraglaciecola mesophila]QHJ10019.1 Nitrate reductase [Paraglaciecola mesophila]
MTDQSSTSPLSSLAQASPAAASTCSQLNTTTCPYCGVGCGVDVTSISQGESAQLVSVQGTASHPANFGRLCVKGSKLAETNGKEGRLFTPLIGGKTSHWDEAISAVANKFSDVVNKHGPDAVAFYVSGQLLTEDYYVANKLMKGYIGSGNIDTNSRLCMSSAVAAYKRAFGTDTVPCNYEDLEQSELLVLVGSNAAWTHPVLFQRIERAKKLNPNMRLVFIDPRRTASCEAGDLHIPIKPGTDVALFNGLLRYIERNHYLDSAYISAFTEGFDESIAACEAWTVKTVADYCDVDTAQVEQFYQLFANSDSAVSFYSMGVNQSTSGVDKANAIINCHLATGKIGRAGCGPFSITGQPNAMGGREVGGLANMLACHMDIANAEHRSIVQNYWHSPTIVPEAGLKAVDMFDAIEQGKVKAIWVMATNPMVSMPNRHKIKAALAKCEMVVVSDCVANNDTIAMADVVLPATGWSEKNGTVTNSERRISRQRGFLPPTGEARHDWQIICDVAKKMGFKSGFNYSHPREIFDEYCGLTAEKNNGSRDLDLSGLQGLTPAQYDNLAPIQWPVNKANPDGMKRMFTDGRYFTASKKAQFIALHPRTPEQLTSAEFPYVLNSGRVRDQWHTMTRTGTSADLTSHIGHASVSMNQRDAVQLGVEQGDLLALNSSVSAAESQSQSEVILPVKIDNGQRKGEFFAPIHWSEQNHSSANISHLFTDANDPISGQPELKHAAIRATKVRYSHHGHIFISAQANQRNTFIQSLCAELDYWRLSKIEGGEMLTFATGRIDQQNAESMAPAFSLKELMQGACKAQYSWAAHQGESVQNLYALHGETLQFAAFNDVQPVESNIQWLSTLLTIDTLSVEQKAALLRAQPDEQFNQGRLICSCFKVGINPITQEIKNGCNSVDGLGDKLKCGTNCGSCKSELQQLINEHSASDHMLAPTSANHTLSQSTSAEDDDYQHIGERIAVETIL